MVSRNETSERTSSDLDAVSGVGSSIVTKLIGTRQRTWADATQKRITVISSVLSQLKTIKMVGLTDIMSNVMQHERVEETRKMKSWGWIIVWLNVVGKCGANEAVLTHRS